MVGPYAFIMGQILSHGGERGFWVHMGKPSQRYGPLCSSLTFPSVFLPMHQEGTCNLKLFDVQTLWKSRKFPCFSFVFSLKTHVSEECESGVEVGGCEGNANGTRLWSGTDLGGILVLSLPGDTETCSYSPSCRLSY